MYIFGSEEHNTFSINLVAENLILSEQQNYWKWVIISPVEFLKDIVNK